MVSTRNTDEASGWFALLSALTDDELNRYGEIARDQRNLEYDRAWAQVVCVVGACLALGLSVREILNEGFTRASVLLLLTVVALGFWPYQKARMRRLWKQHCSAVAQEKTRRKAETGETTG